MVKLLQLGISLCQLFNFEIHALLLEANLKIYLQLLRIGQKTQG